MDSLTLAAGIGWGVTAASWLISPVISRLVNKCFDAVGLDPRFQSRKKTLAKKLEDLQIMLLPQLIILMDAAQKSPYRRELEAWLQKLKTAYYEAEHLLGLVEYMQLKKKANSSFPSKSTFNFRFNFWELKIRKNNLLKSLENLEKIVHEEASKLITMLNLSSNSFNNSIRRPNEQLTEQSSDETISSSAFEVIGRDKDRDDIIRLLLEDFPDNPKCYSVIGIWGMGGSGKTTLAQYVYEYVQEFHLNRWHEEDRYFDCVMWAHVSKTFSVKNIFRRICESLFKEPCGDYMTTQGLYSELNEQLEGKRFLLVLDDAWCDEGVTNNIQQLFAPLQDSRRGSKILVTTRHQGAAIALGANKLIELLQLDQDEFMELFMSRALCDLKDAEKHTEVRLKLTGEKIAQKLHRSPLAATTVAAQLRKRRDLDFWLSMLNQNLLNETMGVLLLSYQNLSPPLQQCFAFFSLFPKGHKFNEDHLVSLWIGEGFIETEGSNKHVRDVGHGYILELISSSFLKVWNDEWKTLYSVHDLLHDLAEKVSNGECFRIEGGEKREIPTHTRHLYVEAHMFEEYLRKMCKLRDLRTIIIWNLSYNLRVPLKEEDLNKLFKGSKKIQVVDLYSSSINGWPESVFCLENLQYFIYAYVDRKKNQRYLINGSISAKNFRKVSSRLYQLRLLRGIFSNVQIPNIGRLTLLQDLHAFEVRNERGCGLEQLQYLRDLYGELNIYGLVNVKSSEEAHLAKLSDKKGLCSLELRWDKTEDVLRDRDADILDELCPPTQIKKLIISCYTGKRCPRWFSEYNKNTTHLMILKLDRCPFLKALPDVNNLLYLQSLVIEPPSLKRWASLPSYVANLELRKCSSLAFVSEEELKVIMSTRRGEKSPFDKQLEKLLNAKDYHWYLDKQKRLDQICKLKETNGELYLPLTLEKLVMDSCFITDNIFASSFQDHTLLTHLELLDIIPITCIPREVLSSTTNLRVFIIRRCLMLTSMGGLDALKYLEELEIIDCPCLTIEMSVAMSVISRRNFLRNVHLSLCRPPDNMFQVHRLEKLQVQSCPSIESPDFSNSKSLYFLSMHNCVNLVSLRGLNELNNLEYLTVVGCEKVQYPPDASKLPQVRNITISKLSILQLISIDGLSSLFSLTIREAQQEYFTREECEILSHLSSLKIVRFEYCKMHSLPDLFCLRSVSKLAIHSCKDLTSLSEVPPSLQKIGIEYCNAEFARSCKDTSHPNCQKISHISSKSIF